MEPTMPEMNATERSEWNVSDVLAIIQFHAPFAIAFNKYVTPVWYIVGIVGNVISALIWSNQRLRTCNTAAFYLTSLALADFSYLALHMFYELENPWLVHTLNVPVWCELWNTLYMAAQYFCVVLVCAFTVERFLSVCHPFRSERFGRTRSPRIILVLLGLSLALASPQAYFWQVGDSDECQVRHSELQQMSFYSLWSWCTDMLVFGALPVLVLLLNIGVLRRIRHAGRLRFQDSTTHCASSTAAGVTHHCRKQHAARQAASRHDPAAPATSLIDGACTSSVGNHNFTATTVTLLWVSFYLIFTTLPVTIVFAIQTVVQLGPEMPLEEMAFNATWRSYLSYYTARVVIKEIGMSHHVGNVFIYLATSRRFRRQVRKRMRGGAVPSTTKHTDLSSTNGAITLQPVKTEHLQTLTE